MKIQVCGWLGKHNCGDESYRTSFPKVFPGHDFVFSDALNYKESADAIILGGGDIFNSVYVNKVLKYNAKRKLAISVPANVHTPIELLNQFDQIVVRDKKSVDYLTKHNVSCTYMPDVSTSLTGDPSLGREYLKKAFASEGLELYQKVVGIVFNSHLFTGKCDMYARDFVNFNYVTIQLAKIIDNTPASFVFFPMSTGMPYDDRITNSFLANRCKFWKKNMVVYDRLQTQETINLISSLDAVISSRLHASIFSLNSHVPFLDITHHDKNKSFLETNGLEDCSVSYWNFDLEKADHLLKSMIDNSTHKERLKSIHQQQIEVLESESKNVCFL